MSAADAWTGLQTPRRPMRDDERQFCSGSNAEDRFFTLLKSVIEVAGDASGLGPIKWFGKGVKAAGEFAGRKFGR